MGIKLLWLLYGMNEVYILSILKKKRTTNDRDKLFFLSLPGFLQLAFLHNYVKPVVCKDPIKDPILKIRIRTINLFKKIYTN